jgi:tetratricopeptide (TPR) repeat protein
MGPALGGDWLGDDHFLVTQATCNHGIEQIPDIILQEAGRCNYRPLRHISYAVDFSMWGLDPQGYRTTNLLLHLAAVIGVFALFRLFGLKSFFATLGAAVFALHPVQVDAVGYVSGRRDVLMGLGYIVSILGAVQWSRGGQDKSHFWRRLGWAGLAVAGAAASVASKEMGVTVVAVITLFFLFGGYDGLRSSTKPNEPFYERVLHHWWLILSLAIPAGLMVVWRGLLKPVSTVADTFFGGSLTAHVATVLGMHARYVELIFFPWRLAGDYAPPVIEVQSSLASPMAIAGSLWLALVVGLCAYCYRRGWQRESLGLAWYVVTMLPVSHIIPHHEIAAEHYLYIPLVGLALAVAAFTQRFWARGGEHAPHNRRLVLVVIVVILTAMSLRTFYRAFDYQSQTAHARATVDHFPTSVRGRARLGLALLQDEGFESAKPHLHYVLGTSFQGSARTDVLRELGEYFVANADYQKSIKLLSEYASLRPRDREPLEALSKAYFETGNLDEAHQINQRLVTLAPDNAEYRYKTALTAWLGGKKSQAQEQVARALQLDANHVDSLLLAATASIESNPKQAANFLNRADQLLRDRQDEAQERQHRLLRKLREELD